jgi:hypothetical protein
MGDRAMNSNLLIAVLGAAVVLFAVVWGLRFVYGYRVENHAVEIVLFHALPVYRVPVDDIELIQKVSWSELGAGGSILRLGNRLAGQCVLIQRRGGRFQRIVITPDDADGFISQVAANQQGHSAARPAD